MRPSAACGRDPGKLFATLRSAQSDTSSLSQAAELISGRWLRIFGFLGVRPPRPDGGWRHGSL